MKLVTWNINGIKARHERLFAWLARNKPDVMCLQEIKSEDAKFPAETYREAFGYHVETFGQKAYNGVAILSRAPLTDVARGFGDAVDDPQSRFLAATTATGVRVMCAYFPNGERVGSEKYAYKLAWMARLRTYLRDLAERYDRAVICGDFNVAPEDIDVHDPAAWAGSVLVSPEERAALEAVRGTGLEDVVRKLHPGKPFFTWWDYRAMGFPRNAGLRIDHVFATPAMASLAQSASVDHGERGAPQPSDHAPLTVVFRDG